MLPPTTPDSTDADIARAVNDVVAASLEASAHEASGLEARTRVQLMDVLSFPRLPIDRAAYSWQEIGPGLKLHLLSQDEARGVKRCLVWGEPGASTFKHNHTGDEVILVIEGRVKDDRGEYGPGEICRSKAGDVHQEHVVGETDCLCFVVYYGDLVPV